MATLHPIREAHQEHSVPWFWPLAAAIEFGGEGMRLFQRNPEFLVQAHVINAPPLPDWATPNRIDLALDTLHLRDFSRHGSATISAPVLIDPPYAGHSSSLADYAKGQSLVETLRAAGHDRVFVMDWKSATPDMKNYEIDKYLADINLVVDELRTPVRLVGLCQGGWMSAMYASRFPGKVRSLVLAGAPIDTDAGSGPMHASGPTVLDQIYRPLSAHRGQKLHRSQRALRAWFENALDLPGRYYLQAVEELFKANRFAKGEFIGLGRKLSLKDIRIPLFLLAGASDDITTSEQVLEAARLVGTPQSAIVTRMAPGGHIGLFMGSKTLAETWPEIGHWMKSHEHH